MLGLVLLEFHTLYKMLQLDIFGYQVFRTLLIVSSTEHRKSQAGLQHLPMYPFNYILSYHVMESQVLQRTFVVCATATLHRAYAFLMHLTTKNMRFLS